ncbi:hypothetical protein C8J56DRAFT_892021 [Mycena floridula]|nr:hypothetical protein C8J56DRAFT_892021 [Mycena floridula]
MPSTIPSTNGVPAKPARKLSSHPAATSDTIPPKSTKSTMKFKPAGRRDDAAYFSSNRAQQTNENLVGTHRSSRLNGNRFASAAPDPPAVPIPQASHHSPGGTYHPHYVFILDDPTRATPTIEAEKEGAGKSGQVQERGKAIPIKAPGGVPRVRKEDYDPYEPQSNNVYCSDVGDDPVDLKGFDLGDLGYDDDDNMESHQPRFGFLDIGGEEQDLGASGEDETEQSSAGLPADVSRGSGQFLRKMADSTSGEQSTKKGKSKVSSSKGPAESALQAKHKESLLREKQRTEKKGGSSSMVPGASSKVAGLTSRELSSAISGSAIAPLQPSLMLKEGEAQGIMRKVSEWSFLLQPPTTKDLPVKPFTKAFPHIPFPGSHRAAEAGTSKAGRKDGSEGGDEPGAAAEGRKTALKSLKFTKTLPDIPENSERVPGVGSQAMKTVQGMYAEYSPNKFTEKTAKDVIRVAEAHAETVVVIPGYRTSKKRPHDSSPSPSPPQRIPAAEKGKSRAVYSSSSGSNQSLRTEREESQKENPAPGDSNRSKRRKSISAMPAESGRGVLSTCWDNSISSMNASGRWVMDLTPERWEMFRSWEAARERDEREKASQGNGKVLGDVRKVAQGNRKPLGEEKDRRSPGRRGHRSPTRKSDTEGEGLQQRNPQRSGGSNEENQSSKKGSKPGHRELQPGRALGKVTDTRGLPRNEGPIWLTRAELSRGDLRRFENPSRDRGLPIPRRGDRTQFRAKETRRGMVRVRGHQAEEGGTETTRVGGERGGRVAPVPKGDTLGLVIPEAEGLRDIGVQGDRLNLLGLKFSVWVSLALQEALSNPFPFPFSLEETVSVSFPFTHQSSRTSAHGTRGIGAQSVPIAPEWVRRQMEKGWPTYIPLGAVTNEKCERGLSEKLKLAGEMVGKLENGRLTFETATQETGSNYLVYEDFFAASVNFVQTIRTCFIPKGEKKVGGRWALKVADRHDLFFEWLRSQPQLKSKWPVFWGYISRRMHHDAFDRQSQICEIDVVFPEILQEVWESLRDRKIEAATSSVQHSSGHHAQRGNPTIMGLTQKGKMEGIVRAHLR